jgi:DNA-binding GntR family transcriptional regulator
MDPTRREETMAIRTKEAKTLVPGIIQVLRELIWKGQLRPGEHISQAEWAEQMGVSLIPLREAMRTLEAEGLLEVMPNRGVRVTPVSAQELEEWLMEFKGMLHVLLPMAIPRMTPDSLARLREMVIPLDQENTPSGLHLEFWRLLFDPCGMPRLSRLVDQLIWRLGRYFLNGGKAVFWEHRELRPNREDFLDACARGDTAAAYAHMTAFAEARLKLFLVLLAENPELDPVR